MYLNILDNFYKQEDFNFVLTAAMMAPYTSMYQPYQNFNILSKSHAYKCHQTKELTEFDLVTKIFINTFQEKTGKTVKKFHSFFRKIYSSEIDNILKYGMSPHKDGKNHPIAGIVHFNTYSLEDGTAIFSNNDDADFRQIEPDVVIGSRPNRCVFYDSQLWHRPLQDKNTEMRLVQPFFLQV